jgi:competence protein ComGC
MKAKKTATHNELIQLVVSQISMFTAEPKMIKKRIEDLIERGYMKRDPNQRDKYIYLP